MRLPPSLFTYDTFQNPTFRPAAVRVIYPDLPNLWSTTTNYPIRSSSTTLYTFTTKFAAIPSTSLLLTYTNTSSKVLLANIICTNVSTLKLDVAMTISCIAFLSTYLRYYFIILLCHYRIWKLRILLLIHYVCHCSSTLAYHYSISYMVQVSALIC